MKIREMPCRFGRFAQYSVQSGIVRCRLKGRPEASVGGAIKLRKARGSGCRKSRMRRFALSLPACRQSWSDHAWACPPKLLLVSPDVDVRSLDPRLASIVRGSYDRRSEINAGIHRGGRRPPVKV